MQSALRVLLMLQCLAVLARADISEQELEKWVDDSTLVFKGTIIRLGQTNVGSIEIKDAPMIVRVDRVESGDQEALKKFDYLAGKEITVVVSPLFKAGPELKDGVSAVFFVDPLVYEKNIAVIANAVADQNTVQNLGDWLSEAKKRKAEAPLKAAVASADYIVTGAVQQIRPLAKSKLDQLRRLENGREVFSEHSPQWKEAIVRVDSVEKGDRSEKMLIVVFPGTDDRTWAKSPLFHVGQAGIWLLHSGATQEHLGEMLLTPEIFNGRKINCYTALASTDFQLGSNLARVQEIINKP
jgi:hypothetical protein